MSDAAGKSSRKPGCKVEKKPIFSIVPVEAWSDKRLTLEQLRVLGAILSFCDKDRSAYPGRKAISTRSGVHIANVSSATSALERLGWLSKKGKGGFSKPSFYTIHVPQTLADQATVAESATVAQQATPMPLADQATVAQQATVADQATSTVAQQARGKELTSEQTNVIADKPPVCSKAADPCPHQEIIDLYHQSLPTGRQVRIWNDTRKAKLRARWKEDAKRQNLDWWAKFFDYIAESDFLTGKISTAGRKPFEIDLEWIVTPASFVKIVEGKYHEGVAA